MKVELIIDKIKKIEGVNTAFKVDDRIVVDLDEGVVEPEDEELDFDTYFNEI